MSAPERPLLKFSPQAAARLREAFAGLFTDPMALIVRLGDGDFTDPIALKGTLTRDGWRSEEFHVGPAVADDLVHGIELFNDRAELVAAADYEEPVELDGELGTLLVFADGLELTLRVDVCDDRARTELALADSAVEPERVAVVPAH